MFLPRICLLTCGESFWLVTVLAGSEVFLFYGIPSRSGVGRHPVTTLKTTQGQIYGFFSQLLPPGGSICGRLTSDLPLGCLQGD